MIQSLSAIPKHRIHSQGEKNCSSRDLIQYLYGMSRSCRQMRLGYLLFEISRAAR